MLVYTLTLSEFNGSPRQDSAWYVTGRTLHGSQCSTVPMRTSRKAAHPCYPRSAEGNDPRGGRPELRLQRRAI